MVMNHSRSFPPAKVHEPDSLTPCSLPLPFEHALPDARHRMVDSPAHPMRGTHRSPILLPDFSFSSEHDRVYSQSPQSVNHGILEPLQDPRMTASHSGPLSDISPVPGPMLMPQHQRLSVSSIGTQSYGHRHDSLGGSDAWSPSSSRGQGPKHPDEQLPKSVADQGDGMMHDSGEGGSKNEEEEPPPWSELKTKAGKERKRLPLACIACRRKKIRCSGEKPACKHCLRSRVPCLYKATARKAGPRTDYTAMLDRRLKRMEEKVINIISKEDLPDQAATGRAVVKPASPIPASNPSHSSPTKKRSVDQAFVRELEDWTHSREQPLPDEVCRHRNLKDGEKTLLTEGAEFLPARELQEHLAEVFFDCVYGQSYLLLHKPSFMRKLRAGTVPPVLVLALCAISARFSTHPQVDTEPAFLRGDMWATPARAIVERRHGEPNMTILIVMVILGLHYFGTCEGGLSWSFGGQAMRMAFVLQLHRDLDHEPLDRHNDKSSELSFTDREIRRRAMWASFLMDRLSASGTKIPPFGNEEYLRIQLPIKESHFQMEIPGTTEGLEGNISTSSALDPSSSTFPKDNMGVAAYVVRVVVLWGRIVKYLNLGGKDKDSHPIWSQDSGFAKLRDDIDSFRKSMPPSIAYSAENLQIHAAERTANQFLYLHIICHQNMLFLYRFAIPVSPNARPPKDIPKPFLDEAGRCVVEAASQISYLIQQAAGYSLTAPFAGYCAYLASTVQVWGMFSQNPELEAVSKENLRHTYKYLSKMKKYWGMHHYMVENIKDIYRQFADAASRGATSTEEPSDTHSQLVQYGDWIDKYPHRISGRCWDDSSRKARKDPSSETVLSRGSDLQSVEEFFASLSSPPKAGSARKVARRHTKKATEIRNSVPAQAIPPTNPHASQQQHCPSEPCPQALHHQNLAPPQTAALPGRYSGPSPGYMCDSPQQLYQSHAPQAGNFNLGPQPYEFNSSSLHPTNPLPQQDRQLVYGAYAGMDLSVNTDLSSGGYSIWGCINMDNMIGDPGNSGIGGCVHPATEGHEPSSAWMLPFNMNPPPKGDVGAGLFMAAGDGAGGTSERSFPGRGLGDVGMTDRHGQT